MVLLIDYKITLNHQCYVLQEKVNNTWRGIVWSINNRDRKTYTTTTQKLDQETSI